MTITERHRHMTVLGPSAVNRSCSPGAAPNEKNRKLRAEKRTADRIRSLCRSFHPKTGVAVGVTNGNRRLHQRTLASSTLVASSFGILRTWLTISAFDRMRVHRSLQLMAPASTTATATQGTAPLFARSVIRSSAV
jgi:hypothetical protein